MSILERLYKEERPQLVIVYGRRSVGKTRLLLEFLDGKNGLYFYVTRGGEETILCELSRIVEYDFLRDLGLRILYHFFRIFG